MQLTNCCHHELFFFYEGTNCQESDAEKEVADEEAECKSAGEEGGSQEEEEGTKMNHPSSPPLGGPPPVADFLRTPQLADFGLSEMQLKRALAGAEWCSEVPPMPQISFPQAFVDTPAPPPMPLTPKCALRMDDDEPLTPQMQAFGISEHTMCLINDFTMDLFQKNIDKPKRYRNTHTINIIVHCSCTTCSSAVRYLSGVLHIKCDFLFSRLHQDIPEPVNQLMETLQARGLYLQELSRIFMRQKSYFV